ncbi:hypothetical protein C9927_04050 [Pseudidiomarina aestuarii]|uniref:DUF4760 domain-containing protein n=1 Tax=Pseudidiomarina aestuarii TaxID=624146 RepID=A0A2T4D7Q6_9GAMM|nr:hypothetical protein C9927_04050 [Pseudidiomarina aestuarii]PTB89855.1 hypothetical protein C9928_01895 [Pseudidiomarina aestuarii]
MTVEWVLIGAFVGALSAFIFNFILWKISQKSSKRDATRKILLDTLEVALEEAVEYWSGSLSRNSSKKILCEAKLKLFVKAQTTFIDNFTSDFSSRLTASNRTMLDNFKIEAFELVTGGQFESPVCKDLNRCKQIALKYTKAILIIKRCS